MQKISYLERISKISERPIPCKKNILVMQGDSFTKPMVDTVRYVPKWGNRQETWFTLRHHIIRAGLLEWFLNHNTTQLHLVWSFF